jgi:hypothetical protein
MFLESGWDREWISSHSKGESGPDCGEGCERLVDVMGGGVGAEGEADHFGGGGA